MFTAANITGCSDVVGSLLYRFFGFLCGGMFTGSAQEEPSLTASDVSVDSHSSPSFVSLHLHHSKTETFGVGVCIFLGRFDGLICPVKLLLSFLAVRGSAICSSSMMVPPCRIGDWWRLFTMHWRCMGWTFVSSTTTASGLVQLLLWGSVPRDNSKTPLSSLEVPRGTPDH